MHAGTRVRNMVKSRERIEENPPKNFFSQRFCSRGGRPEPLQQRRSQELPSPGEIRAHREEGQDLQGGAGKGLREPVLPVPGFLQAQDAVLVRGRVQSGPGRRGNGRAGRGGLRKRTRGMQEDQVRLRTQCNGISPPPKKEMFPVQGSEDPPWRRR